MTAPALRPLSVGETLDLAFGLYRRHFAPLAGIVLVCSGLPFVINLYIQWSGGFLANMALWAVTFTLSILLGAIGTAAAVFVVSESYLGRSLAAGEALRRAVPFIGRLLIYSLLTGLLVGLGFLFLFVPGIILACGLVVGTPALVLEDLPSGTRAMSRSWELTRGRRLAIFGLLFTTLVIVLLPNMAIGGLAAIFAPAASRGGMPIGVSLPATVLALVALGALIQMFLYPLFYCVLTIEYYDLRVRKEAFDLDQLASSLQSLPGSTAALPQGG